MSFAELERRLAAEAVGERVLVLDEVDSTNDFIRRLAAEGAGPGTIVVADRQTAGRGRRGRPWHSPPGVGLYISVLLRPDAPPEQVTRWTLGGAVAACRACRRLAGDDIVIKWPNDVLCGGKKLVGILAEYRRTEAGPELVLGSGFNVAQSAADFPVELAERATSLSLVAGRPVSRADLAVHFIRELAPVLGWLERGDWATVARRWESLAPDSRGNPVRVLPRGAERVVAGVTRGVDAAGALLVELPDGGTTRVHMADSIVPAGEQES